MDGEVAVAVPTGESVSPETSVPRLGFLGLGWIGRHRMRALADSGIAQVAALADTAPECLDEARAVAPEATACKDFDAMLGQDLDGIVIATPSALHAAQTIRALDHGMAVFCQKPLARSGAETREVIASAIANHRLLGVDFSYRYVRGIQQMRERIRNGSLGDIYALSLVFHNAYGPDKPWFYRRESAGGGCVTDLGIHLVDLARWLLDFPAVEAVTSRCFAGGRELRPETDEVEDYATARLDMAGGVGVDLACSWRLPIGRDADIQVAVYGTQAGMALKNVNGSFYDFRTELYRGTAVEVLSEPADEGDWGGRAIIDWAHRLRRDTRFDPAITEVIAVADTIDAIYGQEKSRG
ncbi:MAG TPA: Gfo/Idh/MocA family oxidoreductase [Gammaproteobacteria bacterium]|nr:Gfo/Idh/MocA family oxidoreductase [Gammaproteobacteria bacterium]